MSADAEQVTGMHMDHGVAADELEVAHGREREELQGWVPALATEEETRLAFEKAFDYRGDVTLTLRDGSTVQGYVFDRRPGATLQSSAVRIIPATNGPHERNKLSIAYSEIAALAFTGRDTAAGKSFEAWVKKYNEKRAAGEKNIGIESEALE